MGIHMLGVRRREKILPPGAKLTAVGEVTLADVGGDDGGPGANGGGGVASREPRSRELQMRRPRRRSRRERGGGGETKTKTTTTKPAFTVTQRDFDEYVDGLGTVGDFFHVTKTAFMLAGVGLLLNRFVRAKIVEWRERRFKRRLAEAEKARREREGGGGADGGATVDDPSSTSSRGGGGGGGGGGGERAPGETCVVCLYEAASVVYKECGHLVCCELCARRMTRCPLCRRKSAWMKVFRAGG